MSSNMLGNKISWFASQHKVGMKWPIGLKCFTKSVLVAFQPAASVFSARLMYSGKSGWSARTLPCHRNWHPFNNREPLGHLVLYPALCLDEQMIGTIITAHTSGWRRNSMLKLQKTVAKWAAQAWGCRWPSRVWRCSASKVFFSSLEQPWAPKISVWTENSRTWNCSWI